MQGAERSLAIGIVFRALQLPSVGTPSGLPSDSPERVPWRCTCPVTVTQSLRLLRSSPLVFEGTVTLLSVLLGLHNHFLVNGYAPRAGPVGSCRGLSPSGASSQLGKKMGRGGVEQARPRGSGGSGCGWPAGGKQAEWEENCLVELLVRPGHAQVFSKLPQVWRVSG